MASQSRVVAKNIACLAIATVSAQVLYGIVPIIVAKRIGEISFGHFSAALAFAGLFTTLPNFGFSQIVLREASRDRQGIGTHFGAALVGFLAVSVIAYVLMQVAGLIVGFEGGVLILLPILGVASLCVPARLVANAVIQVVQRLEITSIIQILTAIAMVCGLLWITQRTASVVSVAIVFTTVTVVGMAAMFAASLMFARPRFEVRRLFWLIKEGAPFGVSMLLVAAYTQLPIVLLSRLQPDAAEVGVFAASYKLLVLVQGMPVIVINQCLFPMMFRLAKEDINKFMTVYRVMSKHMLSLSTFVAISLWFLAPSIIGVVFRGDYRGAEGILRILAVGIPFYFVAACCSAVLHTTDRVWRKVRLETVYVFVCGALCAVLCRHYAGLGAAVAVVGLNVTLWVAYYTVVSCVCCRPTFLKDMSLVPVVVAGVGAALTYYLLLKWLSFSSMVTLCYGIPALVVYLTLHVFMRYFTPLDKEILRQVFRLRERVGS